MRSDVPIAVVGMGGVFPGAADLGAFWQNIVAKVDTAREVPTGRWVLDPRDAIASGPEPDRVYSLRGCYVEDFTLDAAGLDIDPRFLCELDPLYQIVLHAGRAAFLDGVTAGIDRERVGVVLAAIALPTDGSSAITREVLGRKFEADLLGDRGRDSERGRCATTAPDGTRRSDEASTHPLNGRVVSLPAALLAGALGLGGGSYTLDAACASSLYAVKLACDGLQARRADAMLAGGVSRPDCLYTQMGFSQLRALSRRGRCAPFDETCDGLVVGEGAGVVLLKRLDDAVRDGDRICGVIRGIGLSNDIGGSLLAPDSEGQLRAMRLAYDQSGWSPHDVDLIECHGTGTPLGDAAEVRSLRELWGETGWQPGECPIGSVKSNVGHLLTAAGAAGLIKVLLALREKTLPPSANFTRAGSVIPLEGGPFRVQTAAAAWPVRGGETRRAAINAFGFGGINAHVLLEEWRAGAVGVGRGVDAESDVVRSANGGGCHGTTRPKRVAAGGREPDGEECPSHATGLNEDVEVAIVGMEARFGGVSSLSEFAGLVFGGESAVRARPAGRWCGCDAGVRGVLGGRAVPGAYLSQLSIPVGKYRLPPNEIPETLPQQLLMLDVVAEAMANAGMTGRRRRPRVGVIIGMAMDFGTTDFHLRWWLRGRARSWASALGIRLAEADEARWVDALRDAAGPALNAPRTVGALGNIIASRIAREFGLGGPSFAISCDEASGLRALEVAVRAIERGEMDAAIVGAVDLAGDVRAVLTSHALRPLSAAGAARPFDASADGSVVGEGAAAVVVKRVGDARAEGDEVFAVVRGIGAAGGGGSASDPPVGRAYGLALDRAYADAGVEPASVGYVEAHGSGDPREDQVEAAALRVFFGSRGEPPALGSVKANVGHTGAAAGMASLVKAVLCLHRAKIPPLGGFDHPCGDIAGDGGRLRVPRVAGVSAMTADGNCVHVVLEGADQAADARVVEAHKPAATRLAGAEVVVPIGLRMQRPPAPAGTGVRDDSGDVLAGVATPRPRPGALVAAAAAATASAHDAFLRFSRTATEGLGTALAFQSRLLEAMVADGGGAREILARLAAGEDAQAASPWAGLQVHDSRASESREQSEAGSARDRAGPCAVPHAEPLNEDVPGAAQSREPGGPAFSRADCLEFATGLVANVLGPDLAMVDTYPVRVRLPGEPLMLVDRILSIEGAKGSLGSGKIVTEHDVRVGGWYLDGGRLPTSLTVEAGQADLFLCSYLGIDLAVNGRRSYRLLDATVTFHRDLPPAGEVIRYEITIDRFVRQGQTYLFFFRFDGTIGGEPVLTMRDGCAGFFTAEETENSGGIILTREDTAPAQGRRAADWRELVPMAVESYDDAQVAALRDGDLAACFGPLFEGLGLRDPLRLPGGRMTLFDRVLELDSAGGRYGLGIIRTEADIHPDDWFLTCHFVDDMTMPGTLMYECCLHALRFFLLRMGWVGERAGVCYQPIAGVDSGLRCRGPVTPETRKVVYQVEIKEIGYRPEPYVMADALMFADGRRVVQMQDMSLRIAGLSRERIEAMWRGRGEKEEAAAAKRPGHDGGRVGVVGESVLYDREKILAFAVGRPSDAFGEPYCVFDERRRIARLPGPPYSFLDRITVIEPEAWRLEPGGWVEAEYDVPPDAWYFRANRQASMSFAVLLEIGLQPCGWLAAYLGSALRSETDLSFRNLGGKATLHEEVFPDAGTLTTRVRLTSVSEAGGMIIEKFDMQILRQGRIVYQGETGFGFFAETALAQQVGIRDAERRAYTPAEQELARGRRFAMEEVPPLTPHGDGGAVDSGARLPARALCMIDDVEILVPDGGPHGLGFIRGSAAVDPDAWFFKAHFYQDPVWPGSLGLESFMQLLKVFALDRWGETVADTHRFEPIALGVEHTWAYRGQIIPRNRRVEVEAVVKRCEEGPSPIVLADGFLKVDGTYIYEMNDFGLRLVRETVRV